MRFSMNAFRDSYGIKNGLVGAEIGAGTGINARDILNGLNLLKLYLIEGENWGSSCGVYLETIAREYDSVKIILESSVPAAKKISDNCLDFVYIDASHIYEDVKEDIEVWYPKVKPGGWLLFHDFDPLDKGVGVYRAVMEFAISHGRSVFEYLNQEQG